MFLQAAADRRKSPPHLLEILDNMTQLYSAAGGIFLGAEYANRDGTNPRRDIVQPCLCVYGTTTPVHFWGALQSANVVDGSLARFIVIHSAEDYPEENENAGIRTPPPALLDGLKLIAGGGRMPSGNLCGLPIAPCIAPDPMTVPMDEEAKAAFGAFRREVTARLRQAQGSAFGPILARMAENASKLALICAVSRDPTAPMIRAEDAGWAIDFIRSTAERTMAEVARQVADNETERNHKRVLEIIRATGPGGITGRDLSRQSQFLDARQRREIVSALIEAGQVSTSTIAGTTKPTTVYAAIADAARE